MVKVGIIGGSGLENPDILKDAKDEKIKTDYGEILVKTGKINDVEVVLVSRHGRDHTIPPTQVNNRGNISALKKLNCTHILATTACGSLKREIHRGDLVILDQFIDFTKLRVNTFHQIFEPNKPSHAPMAEPFSKELREILINSVKDLNLKHHEKGIVITIEGPRFSTKAESKMFAMWGAEIINMSIAPEAALANEIGIPYAAVAMATDYDCLFDDIEPFTWEAVKEVFKENVDKVIKLLTSAISKIK